MAYIGPEPAESFTSFATQEFSTSATTSYTLDHAVANENEIALFVNNVRQQPGSGKAYTATGTALTLSAATASTDTMYCVFLGRALQTVTPATNSITAAMVGNDLISGKTALGATPADTDEFLVSDAGVIKRVDYSHIKTAKTWTRVAANVITSEASSFSTDDAFTTTHTHYKLIGNFGVTTSGAEINMQFRAGGSDITASNYYYSLRLHDHAGNEHNVYDSSASSGRIWNDIYHNDDEWDGGVGIDMSIFNVKKKDTLNGSDVTPGTAARPHVFFTGTGYNTANSKYTAGFGQIRYNADLAHGSNADGLKFSASTGNIMAGSYYIIYGLEDE